MQVPSRHKPVCRCVRMCFFSVVCLRALARVREGYRIKLLGTGSALLAHSSRMQASSTTCPHERAAKDGEIIEHLSIKKNPLDVVLNM